MEAARQRARHLIYAKHRRERKSRALSPAGAESTVRRSAPEARGSALLAGTPGACAALGRGIRRPRRAPV
ncbi:hypothetical protein BC834DRAFT_358144 [Gloeopeniophorella convolvens]|nr:hypothetical protein BC834DRAFT_358144 [Gloeopeniophorella convolvens]